MAFLSSASKATKITLGTATGLVLLVGVLPYIITWNQYKNLITDKVAAQLGREMQINGDIRFSILPRPEAHVSDIVIKNPKGATSENFVQLKQLDVAVALLPLLTKNVEIEKITLVKPAITLEKTADGGNNWTFQPTTEEKKEDTKPTEADASTSLKINDIALEDAYIRYVDTPAKSVQTVGPINANVSLESLAGPYTAKGNLKYNKSTISFDVKTEGKNAETGLMPLLAELAIADNALKGRFEGNIKSGAKTEVSGNLTAQSNDVAAVAAAFAADGKKPNLPQAVSKFDLKSQVLYSADKIALPGMQIKGDGLEVIADTIITTGKRTNVTMDVGRLVVPPSLVGGGDTGNNAGGNSSSEPLTETMQKAFNSAQSILDIAFPTTPLDVIVTADAISLPGKPSIRDMRLAASSDTNQFTLQSLQAKLAGNTTVSITAKAPLDEAKKPTQLIATLNLNSDNLSQAFSTDAEKPAGKDPISVGTTATLNRQAVKLDPLQITQQGQTLNGGVVYQPSAEMPLNLSLRGGVLNLDSLTGKKGDATTDTGEKPAEAKNNSNSILNRLKGFKAQFDVAIDRVITGGKNLRNVVAKGVFSDAGLNLQQAQANLEGLALGANGTIGKLSPVGDLNLTVQGNTANLSQTMQALGNKEARNLGATSFNGTVKGDLNKIGLDITAKLDQGNGTVKGNVLGADTGKIGFDGKINVNHPDTATIVRNFAKMSPNSALGPFALDATVAYAGETIKADNFSVKLGSAGTVNGSVNLTPQGNVKNIDANIQADKLNLAALMGDDTNAGKTASAKSTQAAPSNAGWSRDPVNLDFIRTLNGKVTVKAGEILYKDFVIRNFNNDLAFTNGTMKLNDLSADLFDAGRMVVNGTLAAGSEGKPHNGQFNLDIKDTDAVKFFNALDSKLFAKGTFSAQQQLNFNGASPFQIIGSLNGDGQIKLRDAVANGLDLDALAAKFDRPNSVSDFTKILQQAKAGGTTTIGNVDVPISIRNGIATIAQTAVKTQLTETTFGGTADLPSKTVNMGGQIRFTEQSNMPPLGLKVTGPFSAPRKEFDSQSVAQFLIQKGTAKYQDKAVQKLDKLIGDKIPGGANGQLGGAIGNLLGLPTSKAADVPAVPAPDSTTNIQPSSTATPVTVPVQAVPEPTPAPVTDTPAAPAPENASQPPASETPAQ